MKFHSKGKGTIEMIDYAFVTDSNKWGKIIIIIIKIVFKILNFVCYGRGHGRNENFAKTGNFLKICKKEQKSEMFNTFTFQSSLFTDF